MIIPQVHIVTGGYAGVGLELTKILYQKNATIYAAGRSEGKAKKAIEAMKIEFANSTGKIEFLQLDLDDLSTIKRSAEEFLSKESRLDVLVNNAGVMVPPAGSKTKQVSILRLWEGRGGRASSDLILYRILTFIGL